MTHLDDDARGFPRLSLAWPGEDFESTSQGGRLGKVGRSSLSKSEGGREREGERRTRRTSEMTKFEGKSKERNRERKGQYSRRIIGRPG